MTSNEQRARSLAEQFRVAHALGDGPIKDMFELVHVAAGIDVLSMDADEAEHGLSMTDPATGKVVIAVATTRHPMRQRSSIAHELGHVLAGDLARSQPVRPGERTPEEIRADAFARHLLLPLDSVRRRVGNPAGGASLEHLSELVQEFEVSPQIAAIQMRGTGIIDAATCTEWGGVPTVRLASSYGWLSQYRSLVEDSLRPRAPQALMSRAVAGYRQGVLGVQELATWYGQEPGALADDLGATEPAPPGAEVDEEFWGADAPLFPDASTGRR